MSVAETLTEREQLEQLSVRVRELAMEVANLEAGRRHPMDGQELVDHERRLSMKRRQLSDAEAELDLAVAGTAAAKAERAAERERARVAARPQLELDRAELQSDLTGQLREIERLAPELAAAVHGALEADRNLASVEHELGLRGSPVSNPLNGWLLAIENRLSFILCSDLGPVRGRLSRPIAFEGRDPLVAENDVVLESPAPVVSSCTICAHERRLELEAALESMSARKVAKAFGVSRTAIGRHRKNHMTAG